MMAPIARARTLPAGAYASDDWLALEVERVFARRWVGVRFACELPGAGDVAPFELFGMPLLALRGTDRRLRVFHNIVPYDGCLAVLDAARGLREI